jgi:hypothetical protein
MNINVRMEGGLGDHLLANRFIPAILDKYPQGKIKIFSDTEGNNKSLQMLLDMFKSFYERDGEVINERQNKSFEISTRFGKENYPAHIRNQKSKTLEKMMDCDKFYDLHIDGLNWINHDYDWLRYFYHFPKPHRIFTNQIINDDKYILAHLYSRPNSPYNLNRSYVVKLVDSLSNISKIVIICESKYIEFYRELFTKKNVIFNVTDDIKNIFNLASNCTGFLGIDSGIRYIPYHYGKPTFVFSSYCSENNNVVYSHLIRWLIYRQYVLPINTNIESVINIFSNILSNNAYKLFPEIPSNINNYIVNRELT